MTEMTTPPTCPACGAEQVPIVYGFPPPYEQARRGEAVIGGCLVSDASPRWACTDCRRAEAEKSLAELLGRERLDERDEAEWLVALGAALRRQKDWPGTRH